MTGSERPLTAVVLAAGEGTRMKSSTPKVLHKLCGRQMILWVLEALEPLGCDQIVVVAGHGVDEVAEVIEELAPRELPVVIVEQAERRGTGDATSVALAYLDETDPGSEGDILVLNGDGPVITSETLAELVVMHTTVGTSATILSARLDDPTGYGRIVRDGDGRVTEIVEEADCGPEDAAINEVNAGFYCFDRPQLGSSLELIAPDNAQGEHYLPDAVKLLVDSGKLVEAFEAPSDEVLGVNSRSDLARAESILRARINQFHMAEGVTMVDPASTYIDADVSMGQDVVLLPNTHLNGETSIGDHCEIGPDVRIIDSVVGPRSCVTYSVVREATLAHDVTVGPYASIRPGVRVEAGAHIGTSVELKNTSVGEGSKVPHLSYLGDAEIGADVNVGAGTITCNYDGEAKHRTVVEDGARIGSDTMLVAPVTVGRDAYTAAGSAITIDVPEGSLGVARAKQRNVDGWVARKRTS